MAKRRSCQHTPHWSTPIGCHTCVKGKVSLEKLIRPICSRLIGADPVSITPALKGWFLYISVWKYMAKESVCLLPGPTGQFLSLLKGRVSQKLPSDSRCGKPLPVLWYNPILAITTALKGRSHWHSLQKKSPINPLNLATEPNSRSCGGRRLCNHSWITGKVQLEWFAE